MCDGFTLFPGLVFLQDLRWRQPGWVGGWGRGAYVYLFIPLLCLSREGPDNQVAGVREDESEILGSTAVKRLKCYYCWVAFPPWSAMTARPSSVKNVSARDNHRKLNKASRGASPAIHHPRPGIFQLFISPPCHPYKCL